MKWGQGTVKLVQNATKKKHDAIKCGKMLVNKQKWARKWLQNGGKWPECLINFVYFFLIMCYGMVWFWNGRGNNVYSYYIKKNIYWE